MSSKPDLPASVTEGALRDAVAASRSWRGVLRELGLTSPRIGRQLREACQVLGIDTAHFTGALSFDDATLTRVIETARTWDEAMAALGYSRSSGSARATVRKHCNRLDVDTTHLNARPAPAVGDPFAAEPDLRHLRMAGAFLVAAACALAGHRVSWPLEPAAYDLLVDAGSSGLQRVQVKTTTVRLDGSWACTITRSEYAPGPSGKRRAHYDVEEIDYFGVVDGDLEVYLIPVALVAGISVLSLRKYGAFRKPRPEACVAVP